MGDNQHFTRVDLVEAKNLITKKLGTNKAEKYFNLINRFFSKKLNKSDFNKLCIVAVGRKNIRLHNWFIRSILKNSTLSTTPPPKQPIKHDFSVNRKATNGCQISRLSKSSVPVKTCYSDGELPETSSLRMRMEQKLEAEGLEVSLESAKLLNISLNMYLKKLMEPCLELARSGVRRNTPNSDLRVQNVHGMNGKMQPTKYTVQRPLSYTCASSVDLRAAMELNATLFGGNWALQLEKVALQQDRQMGEGTSWFGGDVSGLWF